MTKFLPAIFFPYFFIKRKWKALLLGLVVVVVITILSQLLLNWRNSLTLHVLDPVRGYRAYSHSQSLTGLVFRFFSTFPGGLAKTSHPVLLPALKDVAFFTARIGILIAMTLFALLFFVRRNTSMVHLEFPLLVAFMIFIPQWNQDYYQIFLVLPLSVMLKLAWQRKSLLWWFFFGVFYLSTGSIIVPASLVDNFVGWGQFGLIRVFQNLSIPALGNLGIIIFFAILYWKGLNRTRFLWTPSVLLQ